MTVSFTIPGRLRGKGRPRFRALSAKGRTFVQTYTDAKTQSAEALVRQYAAEAMRGRAMLSGAVALEIDVYQQPPKSWSKKKRAAARWITTKPDWDNLGKLVSDAINNIVYADDACVARGVVQRQYALEMPEQVRVAIFELEAT